MTDTTAKPNDALAKFLTRYCESAAAPKYAVMLRGPWGSGKTWFIEKFRQCLKEKGKRSLYVSLFGVNSPSDIEDQFFAQIHPKLADPKVQKTWAVLKSVIQATVKVDLNDDGRVDGSVQLSMPELSKWSADGGTILVFDDFERAGMEMTDLLGYINQFVEHDGYRVIVVANEEKVPKGSDETPGFATMKEKVIGRTFEIQPDLDAAVNSFFDDVEGKESVQLLTEHRAEVLKVFRRAGYNNLRQLRQAIFDFSDLWICLRQTGLSNQKEFVSRLLEDALSLSIEYRAGTLTTADIVDLGEVNWDAFFDEHKASDTDLNPSPKIGALKRHGFDFPSRRALLSEAYAAFYGLGHLSPAEARQAVERSPILLDGQTETWRRLWYRYSLSNSDFRTISDDVLQKFLRLEYFDEGVLLHVVAMLLDLAADKLIAQTPTQMQSVAKKVVHQLARAGKLERGSRNDRSNSTVRYGSAYGLGFTKRDSEKFKEFLTFYRTVQVDERKGSVRKKAKNWIEMLTTDPKLWSNHLIQAENCESWFHDEPVLQFVLPSSFCKQLNQLSAPALDEVMSTLTNRYDQLSPHHSIWKLEELQFLKAVVKIMEKRLSLKARSIQTLSQHRLTTMCFPQFKKIVADLEAFRHLKDVQS